MALIALKRLENNPEFRFVKKRGPRSLKEKIRHRRYLDVGLRESEKIADPKTREYFFLLYLVALGNENQVISLVALRTRAAELAAEDNDEPEPPEPEPPIKAARELIPATPASHDLPAAERSQHSPRGPPSGRGSPSNEGGGL
jgi:hypothetical protein